MTTAPEFVVVDPSTIESQVVAETESQLQVAKIYDGQPIRLFIAAMAYREALIRAAIQKAGEQNLVEFAVGEFLDFRGSSLDTARLAAAPAVTTIEFTKDAGATGLVAFVPAGTRVRTSDGLYLFATDENLTIPSGQASATVQATSSVTGTVGNGYIAGQVNTIVDPAASVASAANTTTTNGGADIESDDAYRTRIKLAPSQFSVAGPSAAYEFWARSADSDVIDVAIVGPPNTSSRVQVDVYVLASGPALPTTELLNTVDAALQNDQVRPLTDIVTVLAPTEINYTIEADVTLLTDSDTATLTAELQAAADNYAADRRAGLGRDTVRSQIIGALSLEGVYDVTLTSPASDTVVDQSEWANATSVTVNIVGTNEG